MIRTAEEVFEVIQKVMTEESTSLFVQLVNQNQPVAKQELWNLANKKKKADDSKKSQLDSEAELEPEEVSLPDSKKQKKTGKKKKKGSELFIPSRYILDLNIARLEGAGLVAVKVYGRTRAYVVSELGYQYFEFLVKDYTESERS